VKMDEPFDLGENEVAHTVRFTMNENWRPR
jgi:hypothetical protein